MSTIAPATPIGLLSSNHRTSSILASLVQPTLTTTSQSPIQSQAPVAPTVGPTPPVIHTAASSQYQPPAAPIIPQSQPRPPTTQSQPATHTVSHPSATSSASPSISSTQLPVWSTDTVNPTIHPFTSAVGPTVPVPSSPLEVFQLFLTANLVEEIVDQTNRYAEEIMDPEAFSLWNPITNEDIQAFIGFSILMGINILSATEDYWKKDPVYNYAPISTRISRDRFREISRYLHFVDNTTLAPRGSPNHDRLGKIRPILEQFQQQFSATYNPNREIAIDEAMIKFQGHSSLKQYMPMKPIKRGIKVWVLADSRNGYFSRLEVYTGKKVGYTENHLGARVVKDLVEDLEGKWHHAYFDNFFTSYNLLADLEKRGVYACGTARKDRRGFPAELKGIKFKNR